MKRLCFLIFMFFISCYVRANEIDIKDISLINYSNGINIVDIDIIQMKTLKKHTTSQKNHLKELKKISIQKIIRKWKKQ